MKFNIIIFMMAFLLAGCNIMEDMDNQCPDMKNSDFVNISFNLAVPMAGNSRADGDGHEEVNSEWPDFEDRIYTDDFVIYIYAGNDGNGPLLAKIDVADPTEANATISGGPATYTVNVSLPKSEFEEKVQEVGNLTTFKIAVFANTKNKTADNDSSFSNLIEEASDWTYDIFGMIYSDEAPRIPMYGTITFKATRDAIYNSRPENPIWGGDLYLLRSIAKVNVIDNIDNRDPSTGLPRVESVKFEGETLSAYVLPYDAKNYENGWQVSTPKPHYTASKLYLGLNKESQKWFGYVPEQKVSESRFVIDITYSLNNDETPNVQERFVIPMTKYGDTEFKFGDNILRNHIYTLKITSVEVSKPQIEVSVNDWKKIHYTFEY